MRAVEHLLLICSAAALLRVDVALKKGVRCPARYGFEINMWWLIINARPRANSGGRHHFTSGSPHASWLVAVEGVAYDLTLNRLRNP